MACGLKNNDFSRGVSAVAFTVAPRNCFSEVGNREVRAVEEVSASLRVVQLCDADGYEKSEHDHSGNDERHVGHLLLMLVSVDGFH